MSSRNSWYKESLCWIQVHNTVNARLVENWHNKLDNEVIEEGEDLTKKNTPDSAEFQGEEEQRLESAEDIDFASPYFLWGEPEDKEGEIELKKRIMQDAKDRIMRRAEYITTCYHEVMIFSFLSSSSHI